MLLENCFSLDWKRRARRVASSRQCRKGPAMLRRAVPPALALLLSPVVPPSSAESALADSNMDFTPKNRTDRQIDDVHVRPTPASGGARTRWARMRWTPGNPCRSPFPHNSACMSNIMVKHRKDGVKAEWGSMDLREHSAIGLHRTNSAEPSATSANSQVTSPLPPGEGRGEGVLLAEQRTNAAPRKLQVTPRQPGPQPKPSPKASPAAPPSQRSDTPPSTPGPAAKPRRQPPHPS